MSQIRDAILFVWICVVKSYLTNSMIFLKYKNSKKKSEIITRFLYMVQVGSWKYMKTWLNWGLSPRQPNKIESKSLVWRVFWPEADNKSKENKRNKDTEIMLVRIRRSVGTQIFSTDGSPDCCFFMLMSTLSSHISTGRQPPHATEKLSEAPSRLLKGWTCWCN
jgi:hypothetical protein